MQNAIPPLFLHSPLSSVHTVRSAQSRLTPPSPSPSHASHNCSPISTVTPIDCNSLSLSLFSNSLFYSVLFFKVLFGFSCSGYLFLNGFELFFKFLNCCCFRLCLVDFGFDVIILIWVGLILGFYHFIFCLSVCLFVF